MISPSEIQKKALRQYKDFLSAVLKRTPFFPLYIKGNKGKASMPLDELFPLLKRLLEGAKSKKGFGYTVTLKSVQTRHAGIITMPDEIFFENVEDYLKCIEKEKEFLAFRKMAMRSQKQLPQLMPWMQDNPLLVLKHLSVWEEVLNVGKYFLANPQPRQYLRALPIAVPSTFIENNTNILQAILNAILPASAIAPKENQFEKRFGLLYDEPLIRVRALYKKVFADLPMMELSLPLREWANLIPNAKTVFITTDKMNFLRFPSQPDSLIIWGNSPTLASLKELSWFSDKALYFWGDIGIDALSILGTLRQSFPNIQSFLMGQLVLKAFNNFAITSTSSEKITHIPLLNAEEQAFFLYLNGLEGGNYLEQKHITQGYLLKRLRQLEL